MQNLVQIRYFIMQQRLSYPGQKCDLDAPNDLLLIHTHARTHVHTRTCTPTHTTYPHTRTHTHIDTYHEHTHAYT